MRREGANHHDKLQLREIGVRLNLPFLIWQERALIWSKMTSIWRLSNRIKQVVPQIRHTCSYTPHHSHLYQPTLSVTSRSLLSLLNRLLSHPSPSQHAMIMSWHWVQPTPSTTYTEYSIHRVQHILSTASTQEYLSALHSHHSKSTSECSFSCWRTSLHDQTQSASLPWWAQRKFHFVRCPGLRVN